MDGLPIPPDPFHFTPDRALQVISLFKTVVSHFDKLILQPSIRESFKDCQLPGIPGNSAPQETVYLSEMERVLSSWLPASASVIPQYNTGGRSRCDLVVIPSPGEEMVIEFVASLPIHEIEEHFR